MARIRSIKPEFWKSESIAMLPRPTRLTFIGLWSYVDDNGVGLYNEKLITAELYPLEEDPREALANVREELASLSEAGRILRYTVAGRNYLEIVNWAEHQKIDKPGKPRHPPASHPDAIPLSCEDVPKGPKTQAPQDDDSRESRDTFATPPLSEQWNRDQGTGDQGTGIAAPSAPLQTPPTELDGEANAGKIVAAWIDHCASKDVQLPKRLIGQYASGIKAALDEGFTSKLIRNALASMLTDNVTDKPSLLTNRLVAVQTGPERRVRSQPSPQHVNHNGTWLLPRSVADFDLIEKIAAAEAAGNHLAIEGTTR